jgi:hypothetical protein
MNDTNERPETIRNIGDRRDRYYSSERGHLAARDDHSPVYLHWNHPGEYDRGACGGCYLNFQHTEAFHATAKAEYQERSKVPAQ